MTGHLFITSIYYLLLKIEAETEVYLAPRSKRKRKDFSIIFISIDRTCFVIENVHQVCF
jgi:hypothetical protein